MLACGGTGMLMAAAYRREEGLLRQLAGILEWMGCELTCRATDLPQLFLRAAQRAEGSLVALFEAVAGELSARVAPDAACCMDTALAKVELPRKTQQLLRQLGASLGEFHLEGQLRQLEAVRLECSRVLEEHTQNRDSRIRSYQALGLCGGLILAILML